MKKRGESQSESKASCMSCGESFERSGIFKRGEVAHCEGKSFAFGARFRDEVHHVAWLHPRCWCCGAGLGCVKCSGEASELICTNTKMHGALGAVWATRAALIEHGLMLQPAQRIEDYPADWRPAYVRSASAAVGGRANIDALVRQIAE